MSPAISGTIAAFDPRCHTSLPQRRQSESIPFWVSACLISSALKDLSLSDVVPDRNAGALIVNKRPCLS